MTDGLIKSQNEAKKEVRYPNVQTWGFAVEDLGRWGSSAHALLSMSSSTPSRPASGAPTRDARAVGGLGPCPRRVRR